MNRTRTAGTVLAAGVLLAGLFAIYTTFMGPAAAYQASDRLAGDVDPAVVAAHTAFGFDLFRSLAANESENVFVSPLSVSTALAMAYNGANGSTRAEMASVLGYERMSLDAVNREHGELLRSLEQADRDVELSIGNSVWLRDAFAPRVRPGYTARLQERYDSDVYLRDFTDPSTVNDINGWVDEETRGMIPRMVNRIDAQTVMFLLNAVYFKGTWTTQFDEADTDQEPFHAPGGDVDVQMMETEGNFSYGRDAAAEAARLPYGRGKIAMYVFLPSENRSLDAFIHRFDREQLQHYRDRMAPHDETTVKLPRFRVEYGKKRLNGVLQALGMPTAFRPRDANFSGIAPVTQGQNLYLQFVDHKAVVRVNEEGTEAAAATNVGVGLTSAPQNPAPRFIVDRPFVFLIRDDRTGTVLFAGKVTNPPALD